MLTTMRRSCGLHEMMNAVLNVQFARSAMPRVGRWGNQISSKGTKTTVDSVQKLTV